MLNQLSLWLDYFKRNAASESHIPWREKETLSDVEQNRISTSIATFQLGENSEGTHLQKRANDYGLSWDRAELGEVTRLFIKEEQHHAALLARFMKAHNIALKPKQWTDGVFRKLRHMANYEMMLSILITAELIALVYYRALQQQSGSIVLRCICRKILCDERAHVEFESSILRKFHRQPSRIRSFLLRLGHQCLYAGVVTVVYAEHRQVLRAGEYSFVSYWRSCWHEYKVYLGKNRLPKTRMPVSQQTPASSHYQ